VLIDPHELEICLKVLDQATRMVADDPQSNNDHTVNALLKAGKKLRKARAIATGEAARAQRRADDAAIIAATVTGDPDRIDDGAAELPQAIASSVGISAKSATPRWIPFITSSAPAAPESITFTGMQAPIFMVGGHC